MSVVHFSCYKCGLPIVMGDKFWRKRVKCNRCGAALVVPATDAPNVAIASASTYVAEPRAELRNRMLSASQIQYLQSNWIGITAIVGGVLIVSVMLTWVLFLRDTWEQDHGKELLEFIVQADQQFAKGQFPEAAATYQQVLTQVGDHRIGNGEFARAVAQSRQRIVDLQIMYAELAEVARQQAIAKQQAANYRLPTQSGLSAEGRLDALQAELERRVANGRTDVSDLKLEMNALMNEAKSRVDSVNRAPSQAGYPIEVRRQAAYRTLVQNGRPPEEARRDVEAMETMGLLPDPPR